MAKEIVKLYGGTLTGTIATLFNATTYPLGTVIKTILLGNSTGTLETVVLTIDSITYTIPVLANTTVTWTCPIVCTALAGITTVSVNCHISGISL